MKSLLHDHDLSGKTVVPFDTHAGYGVGSGFQQVKRLCTGCNVLQGFSTGGGVERDSIHLAIEGKRSDEARGEVLAWLREIGVLQSRDRSRSGAAVR